MRKEPPAAESWLIAIMVIAVVVVAVCLSVLVNDASDQHRQPHYPRVATFSVPLRTLGSS